MYLKAMRINEGVGELKEIRNVLFNKSLNVVVDDTPEGSDNGGKGNNVGKTTFLKLIDICLGSKDKKYIWTDNDTGSETTALKNYINEKRVFAELEIGKEGFTYTLKVELFDRGKRYINGKSLPYERYVHELNSIIFNIETPPPTFRQLIGKFVRIKQKEDVHTFLKYLHPTTTTAEYKNIYDFLFKLSSKEDSAKKLDLDKEIAQTKKDIDEIIRLHKFANIDDLKERIRIVQSSVSELESKIGVMVRFSEYERNSETLLRINGQLNMLNDSIAATQFKQNKIEKILEQEKANGDEIDQSVLMALYQDVEGLLGSASKEFDELIDFNNQIRLNKINYYKNRLSAINSELERMVQARQRIVNENKNIISLINADNFREFERTHRELIKQSELLGELTKVQEIYRELTDNLNQKTSEYASMDAVSGFLDNLSKFNEYLTRYSYEIFGQRLYLTRQNSFPLKLSNVDDGLGTGHRKTITLLLDLAYVSFIEELQLNYPRFFVHDVLETVDEHNFRKIIDFINENGSQFVFAILNEKIKDYSFVTENDKILRLSKNDKLFKI